MCIWVSVTQSCLSLSFFFFLLHVQNTTVLMGNSSMVSESMRDNPMMQFYAAVYTMSMVVMLLLKLLRGIIFVKVSLCLLRRRMRVYWIACLLLQYWISPFPPRELCGPPLGFMTISSRRFFAALWSSSTPRQQHGSLTDSPKTWMRVQSNWAT